ncbi:MAG: transketolase [Candidatus Omnitrophota bacterium]|nr:MAG: transketolase [Candidatus Omnitrophota bacterium]
MSSSMKMDLQEKAKELRKIIFKTICNGGGGHIPGSLSIAEILTVLYCKIMNIDPKNPDDPRRDRFILSKGHACVALYAILAERGFFDKEHLDTFGQRGTILGGHPDMHKIPGVEATTGALGHGFPFGVGMALAAKLDKKDYQVFILLGDGECQEGSVWEAAMFAPQYKLDNLTVILDYNKYQALDKLAKIVSLEPLVDKWKAFGWEVREVDGHNISQLQEVFESVPSVCGKPNLVITHTIKGKGISFMENVPIWHYRLPNEEEMKIACKELGLNEVDGVLR